MDRLPPGPYRNLRLDGIDAPWYMIPFDKRGACEAPLTRDHLITQAAEIEFSDVYLFSHGWNNDWKGATSNYERFISGLADLRSRYGLSVREGYRPLLVGVFWPSIDLVLPWERAPGMAAALPTQPPRDDLVEDERRQVQETAEELPNGRERFYELVQREDGLSREEALEFAGILAPLYSAGADELPVRQAPPSEEELVRVWGSLARATGSEEADDAEDWGTADEAEGEPQAAGRFKFNPRDILRTFTVYKMKDRAGTVGSYGVGPLLRNLLDASKARVHLVGHSYGGRVVLSALCNEPLPRRANSLLLLQPAVNYLCFAKDIPELGQPGGYRAALQRVEQPILTTYSQRDINLHRFFHLALRRASDLGEFRIAAPGAAPSIYAALGGYGPGGVDEAREVAIKRPNDSYELLPSEGLIWAVNGAKGISSHSDVINEWTCWALHNQVHG